MSTSNEFMAGFTGCKVVSNTSPNTGAFRGFVVNADAVVSAILDKSGASLLSSIALSGVTLKQGIYIPVSEDNYISSITLTSGSVIMYNI